MRRACLFWNRPLLPLLASLIIWLNLPPCHAQDKREAAFSLLRDAAQSMRERGWRLPPLTFRMTYSYESRDAANRRVLAFTDTSQGACDGLKYRLELERRRLAAGRDLSEYGRDSVLKRLVVFDGAKLYNYLVSDTVAASRKGIQEHQVEVSPPAFGRIPDESHNEHPFFALLSNAAGQEWTALLDAARRRNHPALILKDDPATATVKLKNQTFIIAKSPAPSIVQADTDISQDGFTSFRIDYETVLGQNLPVHVLCESHERGLFIRRELTLQNIAASKNLPPATFAFPTATLPPGTALIEHDPPNEDRTTYIPAVRNR